MVSLRVRLPTLEELEAILRSSPQDKTTEHRDEMIKVFWDHFQTKDDNTATAQTSGDGVSSGRNKYSKWSSSSRNRVSHAPNCAQHRPFSNDMCIAALVALEKLAKSIGAMDLDQYIDILMLTSLSARLPCT